MAMLSTNFGGYKSTVGLTTLATLTLMFSDSNAQAQITSDQTTNTQVQVIDGASLIQGGTQTGSNLFHSFKEFSLKTGAIANFDNGLDIENIFTRVSGGTISEIDGLIQTQGNASLFLLNPAGIVFGANAQLNIGGSFIASTGDRFIFEDGTEFAATNPQKTPLLTITSPIGLQYGQNPGGIAILPNNNRVSSNSSGLNVKPGNTLALLGGDVSITRNSLNGIQSNIEISSIKSGSVDLKPDNSGWQFQYENLNQLGNIDLTNRALIINNSGAVKFQGNNINLTTGSGIINATSINAAKSTINLKARESINLDNSSLLSQVLRQSSDLEQQVGGGGDISLVAPQILVKNGSLISAATFSKYPGGNITIDAQDIVQLKSEANENPPIISTSTQGQGDGGGIAINTAQLTVKNGGQIQALGGKGAGGTITVNASKAIDISGTGILRSQNSMTGQPTETKLSSGFSASSGIEGLSPARQPKAASGSLVINTPSLKIAQEGQMSVSNFGLANAGDILITTSNLDLDTQGKIIANTISGNGGSISIMAEKLVILNNQSSISTTAKNNGDGGKINLETDNLVLLKSSQFSADAQQGSGGKITIDAQSFLADNYSNVTANSEDNQKKGVVEFATLNLNSRLQTQFRKQASLVAENYIYKGCGKGASFSQNQFRNIGRGGVPNNLLQETSNLEILADLNETSNKSTDANTDRDNRHNASQKENADYQPLTEAHTWIVNAKGNIELISPAETTVARQTSVCQIFKH